MSFTCMASRLKRTNERSLLSSRSLAYAAPKSPGGTVFEESDSMATLPLQAIAAGPAEAAHSGIPERVNLALVTPGCIRLEVGEPNFSTPSPLAAAAVEFARKGAGKYTATAGLLSLRERLAAKPERGN